jgi:hypothetical protein
MVSITMSEKTENEKVYDKKAIIDGLRKNLSFTVIELADALRNLPENHECRKITFSDIFQMSSINNVDECLAELIHHQDDFIENGKQHYLNISEIEKLLKCDRMILSKTLRLLEIEGGMSGWEMDTMGDRRGKKYSLTKVRR